MLLLIPLPTELLALHLYITRPNLFSGLIHTPKTSVSTIVSSSYREQVSTAGLASAAHVNFTTQSRHVSLLVTFAVKLTFSGLTAEKKEDQ